MKRTARRLRIGLVSAWASRLGGGVFEAVVRHAALLQGLGHAPHVFALADAHSDRDRERFGAVPVFTCRVVGPPAIGYAPGLLPAMLAADLDVVHLHGIWMYPSHAAARWAARTGRPSIISPHGMLDPWILARGRAKKWLARMGYERRSWAAAGLFHALTSAEADDIRRATATRRPIAVIPNAVAPASAAASASLLHGVPAGPPPAILALGRVHPKKNLTGLIDGWRLSTGPARGGQLVIAGWGEPADVAALEARLAELDDRSIRFIGPVFGEAKAALLASARFFALPSFSEGLPMAVLEAWAAGTPAIITPHCHLPEGVEAGAALGCDPSPPSIAAAIDTALEMPAERYEAMAQAARRLVQERFSEEAVRTRWDDTLAALLPSPRRSPRRSSA